MSLVSLKTELRQDLKLTPQLLQSMEILQMNSQELLEYLNKVSEENPLVEQEDSPSLRSAYEELRQKASWIDGGLHGGTFAHEDSSVPERGAADREMESLTAFLCDQLDRRHLPKPLLALSRYIAELVDEDGWLTQEDLDGLLDLKIPQALIDQALAAVQSLDPGGRGRPGPFGVPAFTAGPAGPRLPRCDGYRDPIPAGAEPQALRPDFPGAGSHRGGDSGRGKGHLLAGASPRPRLPAGGTHRVCAAGYFHCGAGRRVEGHAQRVLSPPGVHQRLLRPSFEGIR